MALMVYSLSAQDDATVLWSRFASGMSNEKQSIIKKIEEYTRDEYGAVSVGALFTVNATQIEVDIIRMGGRPGWVRALEAIAGLEFARIPSTVPASACSVASSAPGGQRFALAAVTPATDNAPSGGLKFQHPKGERLGAHLKRTGALNFKLPGADLLALCKETSVPCTGRLSFNDSRDVSGFVFKYIVLKFKDPGGCKILFKYLSEQLQMIGIPYPNKNTWQKVLKERFRAGRRSDAKVCCRRRRALATAPPLPPRRPRHTITSVRARRINTKTLPSLIVTMMRRCSSCENVGSTCLCSTRWPRLILMPLHHCTQCRRMTACLPMRTRTRTPPPLHPLLRPPLERPPLRKLKERVGHHRLCQPHGTCLIPTRALCWLI